MNSITIATRGSPLAVWQAEHVAGLLVAAHPGIEVDLLRMKTQGDTLLDAPLAKLGGKGLFVKELEVAMLDGRADIAVHSMKDVPVAFPEGLHLPVITERADPRDAFVSRDNRPLDQLPAGAIIGTSSLRRRCQLQVLRPDCRVVNLRGNVQTRLSKLESGEVDATVLALSGLQRLGIEDIACQVFEPEQMLPAIGQGALGIECRVDDDRVNGLLSGLRHDSSSAAVISERAVNAAIGGGCQAPIAAYATVDEAGGRLDLHAMVSNLTGERVLRAQATGKVSDAQAVGDSAAAYLTKCGAREVLEEVYAALEDDGG